MMQQFDFTAYMTDVAQSHVLLGHPSRVCFHKTTDLASMGDLYNEYTKSKDLQLIIFTNPELSGLDQNKNYDAYRINYTFFIIKNVGESQSSSEVSAALTECEEVASQIFAKMRKEQKGYQMDIAGNDVGLLQVDFSSFSITPMKAFFADGFFGVMAEFSARKNAPDYDPAQWV